MLFSISFSYINTFYKNSVCSYQPINWPFYGMRQIFNFLPKQYLFNSFPTLKQLSSLGGNVEGGHKDYSTAVSGQSPEFLINENNLFSSATLIGADNPAERQWSKYLVPTKLIYKINMNELKQMRNEVWYASRLCKRWCLALLRKLPANYLSGKYNVQTLRLEL